MEKNSKPFDSSNSFSFFGSWVKTIEGLETEQDKGSLAYILFKAIADYSMYDETPCFENNPLDTKDIMYLNAIWNLFEKEIDNSIERRKRGFAKDTLDEDKKAIIEALVAHPEMSLRDIAELTKSNKDKVSRVKRKYFAEILKAINEKGIDTDKGINADTGINSDIDINTDKGINSDIGIYSDNDGDSIRHDSDATVRHSHSSTEYDSSETTEEEEQMMEELLRENNIEPTHQEMPY